MVSTIGPYDTNDALTEEQSEAIGTVRMNFQLLTSILEEVLPEGREKAIVRTKLEEAAMWSNKSISHVKPPQSRRFPPNPKSMGVIPPERRFPTLSEIRNTPSSLTPEQAEALSREEYSFGALDGEDKDE